MTPLGLPVVPEVKTISARWEGIISGGGVRVRGASVSRRVSSWIEWILWLLRSGMKADLNKALGLVLAMYWLMVSSVAWVLMGTRMTP